MAYKGSKGSTFYNLKWKVWLSFIIGKNSCIHMINFITSSLFLCFSNNAFWQEMVFIYWYWYLYCWHGSTMLWISITKNLTGMWWGEFACLKILFVSIYFAYTSGVLLVYFCCIHPTLAAQRCIKKDISWAAKMIYTVNSDLVSIKYTNLYGIYITGSRIYIFD